MTIHRTTRTKFVVCVDNTDYAASLEMHKIYKAFSDADIESEGEIRIIGESGEDYIYSQERFDYPTTESLRPYHERNIC